MYCITEQQIEYILNDIRRNGVEKEDLQLNLLDHICCIMEQELKENDDFETFYHEIIKKFYKTELREIEEETINLLKFKNYYFMKRIMIFSGGASAAGFIVGSVFKAMHWPGAGVLLTLAMLTMALVFLPLVILFKAKEMGTLADKLVTTTGVIVGILFCMSTLFKVQHWPGANVLIFSMLGVSAFVYIPAYFLTGIRKPDKKLNTIVNTVLWIGATGLLFTMMSLRPPVPSPVQMEVYFQDENLLKSMQQVYAGSTNVNGESNKLSDEINKTCERVKSVIIENATGGLSTPEALKTSRGYFFDRGLKDYFWADAGNVQLMDNLKAMIVRYNSEKKNGSIPIPANLAILNISDEQAGQWGNMGVLHSITQLQMYLVNAEHSRQSNTVASN